MRIRKNASRFLGSTYSTPTAPSPEIPSPPPQLAPCSESTGSHGAADISSSTTASRELCELSISPWNISISSPQMADGLLDSYYVEESASCLFPDSTKFIFPRKKEKSDIVVAKYKAQLQIAKNIVKKEEMPKKATMKTKEENKEGKAKKRAKVKKEESEETTPYILKRKDNNGMRSYGQQLVSHSNSPSDNHFKLKLSYMNSEFASTIIEEENVTMTASKPSNSSKTRKKKPTIRFNATEDFYYYTGFGPSSGKRPCRSTTHDFAPPVPKHEDMKVELPKDSSPLNKDKVEVDDGTNEEVATYDDVPSCDDNDDFVGTDEESTSDYYDPGFSNNNNMNMKRNKNPWQDWRKPVKERLLKSLL